ncbi:hypothetical protein F5Y10DRAFT_292689 [Nemania abortiva]|nr:hypothetical protein F5Y10DRAFT_292689 [Nemania abortiva]
MFQILRQANQRDGTYVLESTNPPFEKRDPAQIVRLACLRCREKKVRCTGDKDGCQRCSDKGVKCSYANSSPPSSSSSSSSSSITATSASPSTSESATVAQPTTALLTPPATTVEQQSTASTSSSTAPVAPVPDRLSEAGTGVSSAMLEHNTATYDFNQVESDFIHDTPSSMIHDPFNPPSSTSMNSIHPDFSFQDFLHEPILNFSSTDSAESLLRKAPLIGRTGAEQAVGSDPDPNNCYSSHGMLQAFEAVEVCLVWTPRACSTANATPLSLGIDEMLTCQKEVLQSCRARLQCKLCRFRSHDAVLLMNICEKLLGSILRVKDVVDNQRNHDLAHSSNLRLPSFVSSTISSYSLIEQAMFQKQENQHPQRVDTSRNRINNFDGQALDLGLGEWRVDDEDKLHVLASLLRIRMMKLKQVVQELEEVVMSNCWLMHATMVRDLSGYISKCQGGILDS